MSTSNAYEIGLYAPELRDQVLQLQTHLWGPEEAVNDAYMRWKYEKNPYSRHPLIVVARADGRVVGMRGAFVIPWVIGRTQRPLVAACLGDAVVHPEHRRRGLVRRIDEELVARASDAGWHFLLNTSSGLALRRLALDTGWEVVNGIEGMRLPGRVALEGVDPSEGPAAAGISVLDLWAPPSGARRVVVEREPRPAAMAALAATGLPGAIQERRDETYFRWRFANPLCRYRFLYHLEGRWWPRVTGYLVVQEHGPEHDTSLNLVDWAAKRPRILSDLLSTLDSARADADRVHLWISPARPEEVETLSAAGFQAEPPLEPPYASPALLVLALPPHASGPDASTLREVSRPDAWDLRMTASDFY